MAGLVEDTGELAEGTQLWLENQFTRQTSYFVISVGSFCLSAKDNVGFGCQTLEFIISGCKTLKT